MIIWRSKYICAFKSFLLLKRQIDIMKWKNNSIKRYHILIVSLFGFNKHFRNLDYWWRVKNEEGGICCSVEESLKFYTKWKKPGMKVTCCVNPFLENVQNRQIRRDWRLFSREEERSERLASASKYFSMEMTQIYYSYTHTAIWQYRASNMVLSAPLGSMKMQISHVLRRKRTRHHDKQN